MGASSSGLLDEAKTIHIKGLVDSCFQSFSAFYCRQYPAAYSGHLQQEVEPKKQERGLILTQRPQTDPEDVLFQGSARFSTWDESSRKGKDKYVVVKRNYSLEVHDSQESFLRGSAAKLVLQPAGGAVLTSEGEAQNLLDQICSGVLNGLKEDSSSATSHAEGFVSLLHLPHSELYCFLFQNESERYHFLSALQSCIRHQSLDPWCEGDYESQAFIHALQLYRQDRGHYECWEILQGPEEQVLAAQFMEEVLPWLQTQLQNKIKGKKAERIRLWLTTVHAAYRAVLEQLKPRLEALRTECRESATANQGLVRSSLDQITASQRFLLEKMQGCVGPEAERVCGEFISPFLPSVLEALTGNIGSALQEMRRTLQSQIDSALAEAGGGSEVTKKVSSLTKTGMEKCFQQVERLKSDLSGLSERFGLSSADRLVLSAHLDMEKLLDSAVYTFELFLRTSARLQPDQFSVKTARAKDRVLKQLDYDSRLVQRRLYKEVLLRITLPTLSQRLHGSWKNELQQFEQYIFSDFSSFILVQNVYQDVLSGILSQDIQKVLQEAMSNTSSNLLLDTSDLAISQYSLLGQTPTPSTPNSPALQLRQSLPTVPDSTPSLHKAQNKDQVEETNPPVIVVTQQISESPKADILCDHPSDPVLDLLKYESSDSESVKMWEENSDSDPLEVLESLTSFDDAPEAVPASQSPESKNNSEFEEKLPDDFNASPNAEPSPVEVEQPIMKISLETLSEAILFDGVENLTQQSTDKAVYLKGSIVENWQCERTEETHDHSPQQQAHSTGDIVVEKIDDELKKEENSEDMSNYTDIEKEGLVNSHPIVVQEENSSVQPLDSVAAIRDMVIEVTEVEVTISPYPDSTE